MLCVQRVLVLGLCCVLKLWTFSLFLYCNVVFELFSFLHSVVLSVRRFRPVSGTKRETVWPARVSNVNSEIGGNGYRNILIVCTIHYFQTKLAFAPTSCGDTSDALRRNQIGRERKRVRLRSDAA